MRSIHRSFASLSVSLCLAAFLAAPGCGDGDKDYCATYCPAVVAAHCSNGPVDLQDCLEGCQVVRTTCGAPFDDLADCAGGSPTFTCNAYDAPSPTGCESANTQLYVCLWAASEFCIANCPAVAAADCTNGPDTPDDCLEGCRVSEASCPTEFQAVAQCAGTSATFACDANQSPYPTGCQTQNDALLACLQSP